MKELLAVIFVLVSCQLISQKLAKYEPATGVLVFAGQDLESIGGTKEYTDGYVDHFGMPAGITLYTGIGPGDGALGKDSKGLQAIYDIADFGNGPSGMTYLTDHPDFKSAYLAIGLSMVHNEENVAEGKLDDNIQKLGEFLLSLGDRPVFLRTGYEFDGHTWNFYNREAWLKAYKRIKDKLDAQGVTNVAYIWQSVGWVSDPYQLEEWYPGDEYVDWCGFSFFDRWREVEMLDFARAKGKPVFIAESSVAISTGMAKFNADCKETILSKPEQAQEAYEEWFVPYFDMIENNTDVIKAIHYINCDWTARFMWDTNPVFKDIDARLQTSPMIKAFWTKKMAMPLFINATK